MSIKTALLSAAGGLPTDPYFEYTTLLLSGDGTNGAQNNTFLDSSSNNFTITRNGNATQGSFSPYGANWGWYWGTKTDYVSFPSSASLVTYAGNFTIEAWIYPTDTSLSSVWGILDARTNGGTASNWVFDLTSYTSAGWLLNFYTGTNRLSSLRVLPNQWSHVAISREGSTLRFFVNGQLDPTTSTLAGTITGGTSTLLLGSKDSGIAGYGTVGNISNLRIVNGTALYTSAFTPSSAPLTAVTNTVLLTCQANRFRDAGPSNLTATISGTPKVTRFSPFSPTQAYTSAVNGGSAYYSATSAFLSAPSGAWEAFGTGEFTVETWLYTGVASCNLMMPSASTNTWGLLTFSNGLYWQFNGANIISTGTVPQNAWTHLAVSKSSGTLNGYINGTRVYSAADTRDYSGTPTRNIGPASGGSAPFYMAGTRVIKGTGLYSGATIDVPTAPPTAVTNTQLLINFTNGAIFDSTAINDLETVGNAQISTAVKKFGTGSIYLDGTDDRLPIASTPNLNFGTGDFTVEAWVYPNSVAADWFIVSAITSGGFFVGSSTAGFGYGRVGTAWDYRAGSLSTGTWTHVAVSRNAGQIRVFVGGSQVGTTQSSSTAYDLSLGGTTVGSQGANYYLNGYLDEVRITKGIGRYTANFTPPTAPFPNY